MKITRQYCHCQIVEKKETLQDEKTSFDKEHTVYILKNLDENITHITVYWFKKNQIQETAIPIQSLDKECISNPLRKYAIQIDESCGLTDDKTTGSIWQARKLYYQHKDNFGKSTNPTFQWTTLNMCLGLLTNFKEKLFTETNKEWRAVNTENFNNEVNFLNESLQTIYSKSDVFIKKQPCPSIDKIPELKPIPTNKSFIYMTIDEKKCERDEANKQFKDDAAPNSKYVLFQKGQKSTVILLGIRKKYDWNFKRIVPTACQTIKFSEQPKYLESKDIPIEIATVIHADDFIIELQTDLLANLYQHIFKYFLTPAKDVLSLLFNKVIGFFNPSGTTK